MSSPGREVVSIHIGQAGIQMGSSLWEQYAKEHRIGLDGVRTAKKYMMMEKIRKNDKNEWEADTDDHKTLMTADDNKASDISQLPASLQAQIRESSVFFSHNIQNDTHCPRAVLMDLEPNVIDDVFNSAFGGLFNAQFCSKGKEDAANNYARGRYTIGGEALPEVCEIIRKNVENCEHLQSFLFNFAVGGGTGSGFGGLLSEYLTSEYKKKPKLSFAIYPAYQISTCVVEPYNALLATHDLIEHHNITIMLDNEAGYEICQNKLNIKKPSYFNINRLIGKVTSSITAGLRFQGQQQFTISDMLTNLVPYPRLHFMTCGMGPIYDDRADDVYDVTDDSITTQAFRSDHMFTKYYDWTPEEDRYMGVSVMYRGNCSPKKSNEAVQNLKASNKVQLVDWCPTGFKISMIDKMPSYLGDDGLKPTDKSCVMVGNNTAVVRPFDRNIAHKYDLMYSQRSFVHWYVGEGMEEGEFAEAREDMEMLLKDYSDANGENQTDRVDEDSEDE